MEGAATFTINESSMVIKVAVKTIANPHQRFASKVVSCGENPSSLILILNSPSFKKFPDV